MQLTPHELILIANKVNEVSKVTGIDVRQLKVGRHVVFLKRETNQQDGDVYYIVGISDKDAGFHEHPMRETGTRGGGTERIGR